jgi:putative nucleotidyltransferase with HDIG domain
MTRTLDERDARLARIRELLPEIAEISSAQARTAVAEIWEKAWADSEWPDPAVVPKNGAAARAVEHVPAAWTLITHTRAVARLALASADVLTDLHGLTYDRDALLVIALLHDVSKIIEYVATEDGGARKGRFGQLVQHGVYGAFLMWQHALPLEWVHGVISHTPASSVPPRTPEALVVRYVDFLDTDAMLLDIGERLHIA